MIDLVAKKLGVTQTVVDTPFEGIKSGQDLNTGKCDIAAAGMTIKPERAEVIDFSCPLLQRDAGATDPQGCGLLVARVASRARSSGVQSGTVGKDFVALQEDRRSHPQRVRGPRYPAAGAWPPTRSTAP
jgi:polar amino acid transport system substrate-binding protein